MDELATAAKSDRPHNTLGTRLERPKRDNLRFCAQEKPASPNCTPLGQLPTWFLGRYLAKRFVLLPRLLSGSRPDTGRHLRWSSSPLHDSKPQQLQRSSGGATDEQVHTQ